MDTITIGLWTVNSFAALLLIAAVIGLLIVAGAARRQGASALRWGDALLGAALGGVIGGRTLHVALNWTYFSSRTAEITSLSAGGLSWHGVLFGGLLGLGLVARWRGVAWRPLTDALAMAWPIGVMLGSLACWGAACGYGAEVWTLADYPAWAVSERADVYGSLVPRYNTQLFGLALGALLLVIAFLLSRQGALRGLRLWLVLGLTGAGAFVIGFYRGDRQPSFLPYLSASQVLDLAVIALSVIAAAGTVLASRRAGVQSTGNAPLSD